MLEQRIKAGVAQEWEKRNLADRPTVKFEPWMVFYWQAWNALRYDRAHVTIGHTAIEQPIPFTSIDAYARRHDIDGGLFDNLLKFISVIDFAYLNMRADARAQQTPPPKPVGTPNG